MKLYDFQEIGVQRMLETRRMFLADDMGLGKTIQAIVASERIGSKHTLVVCQNSMKGIIADGRVLGGWAEEIHKWAASGLSLGVVGGNKARRLMVIAKYPNYLIINYESLIVKDVLEALLEHKWDTVIFDEHHRIKNRKAKVTRAARLVSRNADSVFMLSGTPLLNKIQDLWAPLNIMFPKDKRFTSFWRFCGEYCDVVRGRFGWEIVDPADPMDTRTDALRRTLTPILLRRTKAEVLKDMPAKTIQRVWVDLDAVQREIYDSMLNDFIVEYQDKVVSAAAVIAQIIRLKQIAVGPELMSEDMSGLSGAKISALLDILAGLNGHQIVVFSQFRRAIERLYELLRADYVTEMFTGKTPDKERPGVIDRFQRGKSQILLVTTQAGGQGLTLTAASTAVFMDKLWTPAMNTQAQDRLHRIGQKEPVTIIELLAARTVEENIENLLAYKQRIFDNVIETEDGLDAKSIMVQTINMSGPELMRELLLGKG